MAIVNDEIRNPNSPAVLPTRAPAPLPAPTAPPAINGEMQMPAGAHQPAYEDAAHSRMGVTGVGGSSSQSSTSGGKAPGLPGIVNSAGSPAAPAPAAPTGNAANDFQPITHDVQSNETVQGQLGDILKTGNPLLEGAKARAQQQANARGLQNSSMAVQSGEEAIVNSAMPIAQADASAYQKQALVNQDIVNQFLSTKMGAKLDLEAAYAAFQKNNYLFDKDASLKKYISDTGNTTQEKVAAMQTAAQTASASIGASASMYATDARLKEAGMTLEAQHLFQEAGFKHEDAIKQLDLGQDNFRLFVGGINNIQTSEAPPEAKQTAVQTWNSIFSGAPMNGLVIDPAFKPTPSPTPEPN